MEKDYKAVKYMINGQERFKVVDARTGEVLDDANGYGYKDGRKAHAAYAYRSKGGRKRSERVNTLVEFLNSNEELLRKYMSDPKLIPETTEIGDEKFRPEEVKKALIQIKNNL